MRSLPATVVSTTLDGPLDWPDATIVRGDAVEVVAWLTAQRTRRSGSAEKLLAGCRVGRPPFDA